jgi:large subunit ribosomal protein L10
MGRSLQEKQLIVEEIKGLLSEAQMAFIVDYKGLSVAEITNLRRKLLPIGGTCKVTKNTLMGIAIKGDERWEAMEELLKGTSAFVLVKEDVGAAVKAYKEFQKESKKSELCGGVMEGRVLTKEQVEALSELPSKEQLYAQIAGALNALTTKIAVGIKEVPNSLARGIKAVSEQDAA